MRDLLGVEGGGDGVQAGHRFAAQKRLAVASGSLNAAVYTGAWTLALT